MSKKYDAWTFKDTKGYLSKSCLSLTRSEVIEKFKLEFPYLDWERCIRSGYKLVKVRLVEVK